LQQKELFIKRVLYLQILDVPAVVNAKLSQRTLRSYWSITFTQELPGKNYSHVRLLLTYPLGIPIEFYKLDRPLGAFPNHPLSPPDYYFLCVDCRARVVSAINIISLYLN
jgi:hypothetical protein